MTAPLILTHKEAAVALRIQPRDLKRAVERALIRAHTRRPSMIRPHRYYLAEDVAALARRISEAGCLENLLTSSPVARIPKPAGRSATGTKTRLSAARTAAVYDFAEAVARTTGKPRAR